MVWCDSILQFRTRPTSLSLDAVYGSTRRELESAVNGSVPLSAAGLGCGAVGACDRKHRKRECEWLCGWKTDCYCCCVTRHLVVIRKNCSRGWEAIGRDKYETAPMNGASREIVEFYKPVLKELGYRKIRNTWYLEKDEVILA